jgi:formylglycine-generating enzyme required for sulfatase activity
MKSNYFCALLFLAVVASCGPSPNVVRTQPIEVGPAAPVIHASRDCDVCPELVSVPRGTFLMWDNEGDPRNTMRRAPIMTTVEAFRVGTFEVTRGEYSQCVVNGYCAKQSVDDLVDGQFGAALTDRHPVSNLYWIDVQNYRQWLSRKSGRSYRLPTEAEWEYAARAGNAGAYYWGSTPENACKYANISDEAFHETNPDFATHFTRCRDGFAGLAPVGSLRPNSFGLYDTLGNVAEYVHAEVAVNVNSEITRGSSRQSVAENAILYLRANAGKNSRFPMIGFRVARDH